jgi:putative endonuclease
MKMPVRQVSGGREGIFEGDRRSLSKDLAVPTVGVDGMAVQRRYFVSILSSKTKRLYVGVTNDLERRVAQHRRRELEGFTSRYNIDRLVYFEETNDVWAALNREKQLKGWVRVRKLELVSDMNSEWRDLAAEWFT